MTTTAYAAPELLDALDWLVKAVQCMVEDDGWEYPAESFPLRQACLAFDHAHGERWNVAYEFGDGGR